MPSNHSDFINFIQSTFLFVQRLNVPNQREKLKNSTVSHGISTFEVVWSVAWNWYRAPVKNLSKFSGRAWPLRPHSGCTSEQSPYAGKR